MIERRRNDLASFSTNDTSTFNFGQQPFVGTGPQGDEQFFTRLGRVGYPNLLANSAEADALKVMLLDHAQTYQAAEDYCEGSVIKAFGELWIAVNDAPKLPSRPCCYYSPFKLGTSQHFC